MSSMITAEKLRKNFIKSELESLGLDGQGCSVQFSGPEGKTKWLRISHDQIERIADILIETPESATE